MKRKGKLVMIRLKSEAEAVVGKWIKRMKLIASKVIVMKVKGSLHLLILE